MGFKYLMMFISSTWYTLCMGKKVNYLLLCEAVVSMLLRYIFIKSRVFIYIRDTLGNSGFQVNRCHLRK